jgi:hypothetical protein
VLFEDLRGVGCIVLRLRYPVTEGLSLSVLWRLGQEQYARCLRTVLLLRLFYPCRRFRLLLGLFALGFRVFAEFRGFVEELFCLIEVTGFERFLALLYELSSFGIGLLFEVPASQGLGFRVSGLGLGLVFQVPACQGLGFTCADIRS